MNVRPAGPFGFSRAWLALCCLGGVLAFASAGRAEIAVKDGATIAFLGDSITAGGAKPNGYCSLTIAGLAANGVTAKMIPAGVSGHKSNQMLARLEKDVLAKKPDWMTLSCGVNDVWHGAKGVPLEDYQANIANIVDQAQAAGIKVMILTSTMIKEDQANPNNQKLAAYNEFLKKLAKDKSCLLADLNGDMQAELARIQADPAAAATVTPGKVLTTDGVHMNPLGNRMMAAGVLRAFGLSEEQMAVARKAWDAPAPAAAAGKKP